MYPRFTGICEERRRKMDNNNSNNHEDNININDNNDNDNDNHDDRDNTHEDEAAMTIRTLTDDQLGSQEEDVVVASIVSVVDEGGRTNNTSRHSDYDVTADGHKMVGEKVNTMYGIGVVLGYRKTDGMFEIQLLNNGGQASGNEDATNSSSRSLAILFTSQSPTLYCCPTEVEIANKLNVAYSALEKMRRLNLEIQCHEIGIHSDKIDYDMCTHCMITNGGSDSQSHFPRIQRLMDSTNTATNEFDMQEQFPRLHNFFKYSSSSVSAGNDTGVHNNQLPPSTTTTNVRTESESDNDLAIQFPRIHNFFNNSSSSVPAGTVNASNGRTDNDDLITTNNGRMDLATAVDNSASQQTVPTSTTAVETTTPRKEIPSTRYFDRRKIDPTSIPGDENPSAETIPADSTTTAIPVEAAVAFASNPPPSQTNGPDTSSASFPRMRNLWSTIQSIPQPGAAESSVVSNRDLLNRTNTSLALTASAPANMTTTTTITPPAPTSSTSFPRIRGLLNSSVSSSIFGDNQISNKNGPADRGIVNSGISSSSQTSYTSSSNSASIKSDKPIALPRIQKLIDKRTKANTHPCLICASPSCSSHSSASFRKEGITLCLHCERLFELDFIVGCVSAPDATLRAERIDYMIDCYDRCMLLLQYSTQFVEKIAECLEDQKEQQNKIGLASSSVGVLSGVLGNFNNSSASIV
ncbi:MAG: hypothetical protein ACI90V_001494 [Bacillariaceae sp.]